MELKDITPKPVTKYELTLNKDELVKIISALRYQGTNKGKGMVIDNTMTSSQVGDKEASAIAAQLATLMEKK